MTATTSRPTGAHLVGSVPLNNSEEVFRTASSILGDRLRRIPDGETGDRLGWIAWQIPVFQQNPLLESVPPESSRYGSALGQIRLAEGADPGQLKFDNLGYADAAKSSYQTFTRLKQAGDIPAHARFLVSLPTPLASISAFIVPESQAAVEPAYEDRMLVEMEEIAAAIPHDELSIQWDTASEFAILEGIFPTHFSDLMAGIVERLVRIGRRVPDDVELGYHLCYGDYQHQHFKEPEDTRKLVDIANAISAGVQRPIQFIHLPVPRDRDDEAYFAPLRDLQLHPETELYLGLVHYTDGVEGTRRRIETAKKVVPSFGVATECGLGRRPAETIPDLLRIHAEVSDPVSRG